MAFDNLMKNSGNALAKLQQKVSENKGGGKKDPRVWKIPYDKDCVGTSLIRLLPWGDGERTPWVEWAEFSFQGKGGKYWNRSLKSIGKDDPVEELNQAQWNLAREVGEDRMQKKWSGPESTAVKSRSDKMKYVCNIFVLEDNMNPEHVGQVKLFKYGPAIHKKIMSKLMPEYKDQAPVQVFDLINGANLRIRSKGKSMGRDTVPNYDDSEFMSPEPLHSDMDVLRGIYDKMVDLTEFEADDQYKSYEDLQKELNKALGPREVSRILGEEFSPAMAENAGHNPFPEAGGAGQADPFAGSTQNQGNQQPAQQQQQQQADPFAKVDNAGAADPFAQAAGKPAAGGADPFAAAGGADPFATAQQEPAQQEPAQQQQADPFAQQQQQAPSDDPFANIAV